jgi:small subunit ribosomal protein S5
MITVKLSGNTISHDVNMKLGSAKVLLKPASEGRGVIAGGAVRAVVDLAGIRDIVSKSLGTSNKLNVARATIEALKSLKAPRAKKEKEPASNALQSDTGGEAKEA